MICSQSSSLSSAPPVATTSSTSGMRSGDLREPEGDALERRLAQVERRRGKGQAVDRAVRVLVPAGAALAAEERQERQSVRVRVAVGERAVRILERLLEPVQRLPPSDSEPPSTTRRSSSQWMKRPVPRVRLRALVNGAERA